jgi:hypothetical protein
MVMHVEKIPLVAQVLNVIFSHVTLREAGMEQRADKDKMRNYCFEVVELPSEQKVKLSFIIYR